MLSDYTSFRPSLQLVIIKKKLQTELKFFSMEADFETNKIGGRSVALSSVCRRIRVKSWNRCYRIQLIDWKATGRREQIDKWPEIDAIKRGPVYRLAISALILVSISGGGVPFLVVPSCTPSTRWSLPSSLWANLRPTRWYFIESIRRWIFHRANETGGSQPRATWLSHFQRTP